MQKRSSVTISIAILQATLTPQNKMRLMHSSNLNYVRINKYLSHFLKKGLIETTKNPEGYLCYHISPKGKTLLAVLKEANEFGFTENETSSKMKQAQPRR
jgi:predicted transcriptional regulator